MKDLGSYCKNEIHRIIYQIYQSYRNKSVFRIKLFKGIEITAKEFLQKIKSQNVYDLIHIL